MFISPIFLASSCNNEQELTSINQELIIGSWGSYKITEIEYVNGQIESTDTILTPIGHSDYIAVTFTPDGKFIYNGEDTMTYSITGNNLSIFYVGEVKKYSIQTLTQKNLTISFDEIETDMGERTIFSLTTFFERISNTNPIKTTKK